MEQSVVNLAEDFSEFPSGRYKKLGEGSGEEFREKFLLPALGAGRKIKVILDGVSGYTSSFLEEAFGGLVRSGVQLSTLETNLEIVAQSESFEPYKLLAWDYIKKASDRTE